MPRRTRCTPWRHPVGIELSLGVDEHDLLERVHRLENRVHGAVGEAEKLVRRGTRAAGEPLAQRGPCERKHLPILEVVVGLLRPAQRGARHRLGRSPDRDGETREQHDGAEVAGHGIHSGSSEERLRTVLRTATRTVSGTALNPAGSLRIVWGPGLTTDSTRGARPASTPTIDASPYG